jgi:predicted alpha/beta-fold hydrolase
MFDFSNFGYLEDTDTVIRYVHSKYPTSDIYLVGYSMGSIQSLRWVAENKGKQNFVKGVFSLSNPVGLQTASPMLSESRHLIYAYWMTKSLRQLAHNSKPILAKKGIEIDFSSHR